MKIKSILAVIIIAFLYSGCDKIEAPYRVAFVAPDFCTTGIDDSIPNKKVLVEDYTGHGCGNCPEAGIYLNDSLKPLYNHCLVVVSVHAGFFAGTCPNSFICQSMANKPANSFLTDFSTPVGDAWNTFFGITGNPKGMVDRIDYTTGSHSKTYNAWSPAIAAELAENAKATIKITNTFNQGSNSVGVAVESKIVEDLQGDYKLQVVITEDSLPDWQLWYNHLPSEYEPNYLHRHVLRDGLNTTWGEALITGGAVKGTAITKNYNYTLNNAWNVNHCNIVAFIYDAATYKILQVEEMPVK